MVFDCDATLSSIEGIDELAKGHPDEFEIQALTEAAMSGERRLDEIYSTRLDALQPSRSDVALLADAYKRNLVPGAREVIAALRRLDHDVYIVSGGLAAPVRELGVFLGVQEQNVFAVETVHDRLSGMWWLPSDPYAGTQYAGHATSELATAEGKVSVLRALLNGATGGSVLIGDGASDLAARDEVDLFVGFGGVSHRDLIATHADMYLGEASLFGLLPLVAGTAARPALHEDDRDFFERGLSDIAQGVLTFRSADLQRQFAAAFFNEGTHL